MEEGEGLYTHAHVAPRVRRVPTVVQSLRSTRRERCYDLRYEFVLQHTGHVESIVAAESEEAVEGQNYEPVTRP